MKKHKKMPSETSELVKDVMSLFKAAEFHLMKFISTNKESLLSIPESQRRTGVKDQDLSGQIWNDKALEFAGKLVMMHSRLK